MPQLGVRELNATWEMLVEFKNAIRNNDHWRGDQVQAVAMGLQMIMTLEGQYRSQLEVAKQRQKENAKSIKDQIEKGGGVVSNNAATNAQAESVH